jgi:hypothetical protein
MGSHGWSFGLDAARDVIRVAARLHDAAIVGSKPSRRPRVAEPTVPSRAGAIDGTVGVAAVLWEAPGGRHEEA